MNDDINELIEWFEEKIDVALELADDDYGAVRASYQGEAEGYRETIERLRELAEYRANVGVKSTYYNSIITTEREACARIADDAEQQRRKDVSDWSGIGTDDVANGWEFAADEAAEIAKAIRARTSAGLPQNSR